MVARGFLPSHVPLTRKRTLKRCRLRSNQRLTFRSIRQSIPRNANQSIGDVIRDALITINTELAGKLTHLSSFDAATRIRILREYLETLHRIDRLATTAQMTRANDLESAIEAVDSTDYDSALPFLLDVSNSSDPFTRCTASMLLGRVYSETLLFRDAAEVFERVATAGDCGCNAHAWHLAVESWRSAGESDKALAAIDAMIPVLDTYPLRSEVVRVGLDLMLAQERYSNAVALSAHTQANADLLYLTAKAYKGLGRLDSAAELFRRIVLDHPASPHAADSASSLEEIRTASPGSVKALSVSERIEQAKKLDTAGLREKAADKLDGLIREKLSGTIDLECRMLKTKILMDLRKNEKALEEFSVIQKKYSKDIALAAVFLRKGIIYRRIGNDKKFLEALGIVEKRFPSSSYWVEALLTRGEYYRGQGKLDLAAKDFEAVAARGGSTAAGAAWRRAWIAYDRKDFASAASLFGKLASSNRGNDFESQAEYWQGRSLLRAG